METLGLKKSLIILSLVTVCVFSVASARANTIFTASLDGAQEVPPTGSAGTGLGQVILNNSQTKITVKLSFSGLSAPAILGHIHGPAPVGVTAPVLFPFTGVPAATSGSIPIQSFAITPTQVSDLFAGLFYFNVHTSNFPSGEIRGQIQQTANVPDGGTSLVLLGFGVVGLLAFARGITGCQASY